MNPEKCQLFWKEVQYLGHTVSLSQVTIDPRKLEAVKSWPRPNDRHQLRSFLGLCTYYRRFIAGFADIAKLLTRLREKKWTFKWSPEAETAVHSLRGTVYSNCPGLPTTRGEFIVDTNTINVGIGGALSQVPEEANGLFVACSILLTVSSSSWWNLPR